MAMTAGSSWGGEHNDIVIIIVLLIHERSELDLICIDWQGNWGWFQAIFLCKICPEWRSTVLTPLIDDGCDDFCSYLAFALGVNTVDLGSVNMVSELAVSAQWWKSHVQ